MLPQLLASCRAVLHRTAHDLTRPLRLEFAETRTLKPNPDTLCTVLERLRPALATAAQEIYDNWEQDEEGVDEERGSGGICDEIADHLIGVIAEALPDAEFSEGGQDGDDHAWLVVSLGTETCDVDIPPNVYERGGGYCWRKRHGVTFRPESVVIAPW